MANESTGDAASRDTGEARADERRLLARRYRLGKPVGRGGMGTVWQAHDEVLGRDVAVKEVILPHGLSDDERAIQYKRTFREARTAARLGHPGVVTVYDVVEEDGRPWIIMELIRSHSLDQVIKREGPLPPRRAAEIGRQMLAALHAAHKAGVLHRDVKPSNVLLGDGDRAVLTDFGIATATGDVTLTQTGLVMGSPAYIAPERARGRTVGPASDLWSLGITLYAMVDGKSPYERSEPMASLVAIISEEPQPAANAGPLAPVIEGLLRKDPDERMNAHEAGALMDEIVRAEARAAARAAAPVLEPTRPIPVEPEEPASAPAEPEDDDAPAMRTVRDGAEARALGLPWADGEAAADADEDLDSDARTEAAEAGLGADPTMPASPSPSRPGLPRIRVTTTSVIIVIIGIALLALGIVALRSTGSDHPADRRSNSKGSSTSPRPASSASAGTSSAAKSSSSAKPGTGSSGVPAGFRLHKDRTGFSVAVPEDWKGPEKRSASPSSVYFSAPSGSAYIQIDQKEKANSSALTDWRRSADNGPNLFSGYEQIKVAPVTEGEPVTDPSGKKAADWEFTHGSAPTHVLDRGFVMNGHGYAILVSAPHKGWDALLDELAPVFASFEPAD